MRRDIFEGNPGATSVPSADLVAVVPDFTAVVFFYAFTDYFEVGIGSDEALLPQQSAILPVLPFLPVSNPFDLWTGSSWLTRTYCVSSIPPGTCCGMDCQVYSRAKIGLDGAQKN